MSTADFTQSVPDALARTAWFWETIRWMKGVRGSWLGRCSGKMLQCQRYSYLYSYSVE